MGLTHLEDRALQYLEAKLLLLFFVGKGGEGEGAGKMIH